MPLNQSEELTFRLSVGKKSIVASVNETMAALKIGRAKTYELLNSGILESYLEGSSRKVTWRSIEAYIERRLKEEVDRRAHIADKPKYRNRVA
ncbi:hypothetical protein WDM22_21610 [Bradyrhizobium septentrionale]|uniref:hypothetical protein n=1 Tax=Bradyrhizobium septentrionale TaxID=1404411 RepID=UPI0030D1A5DD